FVSINTSACRRARSLTRAICARLMPDQRTEGNMLTIDGAFGEGGGQIIRTSLALALITGTPFRIYNVRARRAKPGLQRQHLTAVNAAAEIGEAKVDGAAVGSQEFTFTPGKVTAGEYTFSIATAGSTTLVLQTVLPPLIIAHPS